MIRILSLFGIFLLTYQIGAAQQENFNKILRKQVKKTAATYQLDKKQTKKLTAIEKEYLVNLQEIQSLISTDPELYYQKKKAIRSVSEGVLQRLLTTQQKHLYTDVRKKRQQEEQEIYARYDKQGGINRQSLFQQLSELY